MRIKKTFLLFIILAIPSLLLSAQQKAHWVSMNSEIIGTDQTIRTTLRVSDYLYIAGSFSAVKNIKANRIARLHIPTGKWSALGEGIQGRYVQALAMGKDGTLYVGGQFEKAGKVETRNIASWNGTKWSALGNGVHGGSDEMPAFISSLIIQDDGAVVVGGYFSENGCSNICVWNGTKWNPLGTGLNGLVNDMALNSQGILYTVGNFSDNNGTDQRVARWDGKEWALFGENFFTNDNKGNISTVVIDSEDNLIVGGSFTLIKDLKVKNVAKWNGQEWRGVGTKIDGSVFSLKIDKSGTLYAAGNFYFGEKWSEEYYEMSIARWNGKEWESVGKGVGYFREAPTVFDIATDREGNLYIVGSFYTAGCSTTPENHIVSHFAVWNGQEWKKLGQGFEKPISTLTVDSKNNLYVAGDFLNTPDGEVEKIAKWSGGIWSDASKSNSGEYKDNLRGYYYDNLTSYRENIYISYWEADDYGDGMISTLKNGIWSQLPNSTLNYHSGDITTNSYGDIFVAAGSKVIHLEGDQWHSIGEIEGKKVASIVFNSKDELFMCGKFSQISGVTATNVAKWNGKTWQKVGDNTIDRCDIIAIDNNDVPYSIGKNIAQLDQNQWKTIGTIDEKSNITTAIFDSENNLYIAGLFEKVNTIEANNIAKWDGTTWSPLGDGTDGTISEIAIDAYNRIFIAGKFFTAGDMFSPYIAQYDLAIENIPEKSDEDMQESETDEIEQNDNDSTEKGDISHISSGGCSLLHF